MPDERLVLDTHIWFWSVTGDSALKKEEVERIARVLKSGTVFIAAVSVWEIALLAQRSRIQLTLPVREWVSESLDRARFVLAPLSAAIAVDAVELPGRLHNDPADRMIIATARAMQAQLMTHDRRIIDYGRAGYVNVYESKPRR